MISDSGFWSGHAIEAMPGRGGMVLAWVEDSKDGRFICAAVPVARKPGLRDPGYRAISVPWEATCNAESIAALQQAYPLAGSLSWLEGVPVPEDNPEYTSCWREWAAQRVAGVKPWHPCPTRREVARRLAGLPDDLEGMLQ